jgi:hypothetical protein
VTNLLIEVGAQALAAVLMALFTSLARRLFSPLPAMA